MELFPWMGFVADYCPRDLDYWDYFHGWGLLPITALGILTIGTISMYWVCYRLLPQGSGLLGLFPWIGFVADYCPRDLGYWDYFHGCGLLPITALGILTMGTISMDEVCCRLLPWGSWLLGLFSRMRFVADYCPRDLDYGDYFHGWGLSPITALGILTMGTISMDEVCCRLLP